MESLSETTTPHTMTDSPTEEERRLPRSDGEKSEYVTIETYIEGNEAKGGWPRVRCLLGEPSLVVPNEWATAGEEVLLES